jgi:hypothetical protein
MHGAVRYVVSRVEQHNFRMYGNALTFCIRGIYFRVEAERKYRPHSERCIDFEFVASSVYHACQNEYVRNPWAG